MSSPEAAPENLVPEEDSSGGELSDAESTIMANKDDTVIDEPVSAETELSGSMEREDGANEKMGETAWQPAIEQEKKTGSETSGEMLRMRAAGVDKLMNERLPKELLDDVTDQEVKLAEAAEGSEPSGTFLDSYVRDIKRGNELGELSDDLRNGGKTLDDVINQMGQETTDGVEKNERNDKTLHGLRAFSQLLRGSALGDKRSWQELDSGSGKDVELARRYIRVSELLEAEVIKQELRYEEEVKYREERDPGFIERKIAYFDRLGQTDDISVEQKAGLAQAASNARLNYMNVGADRVVDEPVEVEVPDEALDDGNGETAGDAGEVISGVADENDVDTIINPDNVDTSGVVDEVGELSNEPVVNVGSEAESTSVVIPEAVETSSMTPAKRRERAVFLRERISERARAGSAEERNQAKVFKALKENSNLQLEKGADKRLMEELDKHIIDGSEDRETRRQDYLGYLEAEISYAGASDPTRSGWLARNIKAPAQRYLTRMYLAKGWLAKFSPLKRHRDEGQRQIVKTREDAITTMRSVGNDSGVDSSTRALCLQMADELDLVNIRDLDRMNFEPAAQINVSEQQPGGEAASDGNEGAPGPGEPTAQTDSGDGQTQREAASDDSDAAAAPTPNPEQVELSNNELDAKAEKVEDKYIAIATRYYLVVARRPDKSLYTKKVLGANTSEVAKRFFEAGFSGVDVKKAKGESREAA